MADWSADSSSGPTADDGSGPYTADQGAVVAPLTNNATNATGGPLQDVAHFWGNDLNVTASGDLLLASGLVRSQQRILRRLLTNPGTYISQKSYGAGLPAFIGSVADAAEIAAVTRSQMLLEDSVAQNPAPVVTVNLSPTGQPNAISETIQYTDTPSNAPTVLAFTATN